MKTRGTLIPVGLAIMTTLAACGSHAAMSKADYIAKADAICAKGAHDIDAIGPDTPLAESARRTNEIFSNAVDQIEALDPPAEGAAEIARWTVLLDRELAVVQRFGQAASANDRAQIGALGTQAMHLEDSWRRLAQHIGLHDCAK